MVSTLDFQSVIPGSNPDSAKLYSLFKFNQIEIKMWRKWQSHGFEPHHRQTDKLYVGKSSLCAGAVCSIKESSGPQNQRVHLVLKASKSAGAKGDVPKISGCVHPLHPC